MIILVGASASGKTEISHILTEKYGYKKCVTTTTRDKRINEKDGVDYHFVSKDEFLRLKGQDAFAESASYQDNYYGLQIKDIKENGIIILEPKGVNALIEQKRDVFIVYIKTSDKLRKKRMEKRLDKKEQIEKRMLNDKDIFKEVAIKRIDLLIENEDHSLDDLAKRIHDAYLQAIKIEKI